MTNKSIHPVDERLPGARLLTLGLQHVLVMYAGAVAVPLIAPNFKQWMAHGIHPLIESGILLSSLSAVALNLFFNGAGGGEGDAVEAAKQAGTH